VAFDSDFECRGGGVEVGARSICGWGRRRHAVRGPQFQVAQAFGHFGHRERSLDQLAWKAERLYDDSDPKQPYFQHTRSLQSGSTPPSERDRSSL
jgi:hypothetical protein